MELTRTHDILFERFSRGFPTSKTIARELHISPKTVDKHFSEGCRRLNAANRRDALAIWLARRELARGDDPPGGPTPLPRSRADVILFAATQKEVANHDEQITNVIGQFAPEPADAPASESESDLAGSGTPALADRGWIGSQEPSHGLGREDREAVPLGSFGDDLQVDSRRDDRDRGRTLAAPSFGFSSDEHQLSWSRQIVSITKLAGIAGTCSLFALLAVKVMLGLFQ